MATGSRPAMMPAFQKPSQGHTGLAQHRCARLSTHSDSDSDSRALAPSPGLLPPPSDHQALRRPRGTLLEPPSPDWEVWIWIQFCRRQADLSPASDKGVNKHGV